MYKVSKYTLVEEFNSNVYIINTYTGAIGHIDDTLRTKLSKPSLEKDEIDDVMFELLVQNGFVVRSELDEYQRIIDLEKKAIYNKSDTLLFTIATSMKCNYACKYCFEPIEQIADCPTMNFETAKIVAKYIIDQIDDGTKNLVVSWFGGEPLLGFDAIKNISNFIIGVCDSKNINYHSEIITNGYFLSKKIAKELSENYRVKAAQITIDGPEKIYEDIKSTPEGAYNKVIQNIKDASDYMRIDIRLNIPEFYYDRIDTFVDDLMMSFGDCNIRLYLAEVCDDWTDYCGKKEVKSSNYWNQNVEFSNKMKEKYPNHLAKIKLPLAFCGMKCGMIKKHNSTIGANGELYRCVHMVGRDREIIGTCKDGLFHNDADIKFDTIQHPEKCRECIVFPICMTGCPNDVLEGKQRVSCEIKCKSIINELLSQIM